MSIKMKHWITQIIMKIRKSKRIKICKKLQNHVEEQENKVSSCAIINDHDSKWNSLYSNQTPISVVNEEKTED